ncbi:MAG: hypothetical protein DME19_01390 [Verrucomicrobia bacterium]|nr:MAG: hypothetical protein DME19_01390 [Verrucomicrobiota bacterium]
MAVGSENAQVCDLICMLDQPGSSRLFEPGLQYVPVSRLNHSRSNGQIQPQCPWIIQAVGSVCQIPVPITHRGRLLRRGGRLQMFSQGLNDLILCTTLEASLLGSTPSIRGTGTATLSGRPQVIR